jgi:Flp pilus assembly protein TadD
VHKLAPNNPDVTLTAGRVAYKAGDYQWAYGLLQESARTKDSDPEVLFDLANSAFSVGKVAEAEEAMHHAIDAGISGTKADVAKNFLAMTAIWEKGTPAVVDKAPIEQVLKTSPDFVPAMMAMGSVDEANHDSGAAIQYYEKVLGQFPDFSPAERSLAILYSSDPSKDQQTLDLASKAISVYPEDPEVEKAKGLVVYRKNDYTRAVELFQESAQQRSNDPELYYYLGMSRFQLKDMAASHKALQHALDLGLSGDLAVDARKTLELAK